ncbi:MAG: hypothetical protein H6600_00730 [Flavobacteriales bacterium]|nr:hypothetical protein [Flavobacteriales bacterium]
MKMTLSLYRNLVVLLLVTALYSCGANMEDNEEVDRQFSEDQSTVSSEEYNEAAASNVEEEYSKKDESLSIKKWNDKAKQQLESVQDLMLILNDSELDLAFRVEVEKELGLIYNSQDSVLINLFENEIDFKSFKSLEKKNGDTLSMSFKNNKDNLKAEFIVVMESKDFGGTTELVERLKLLSIKYSDQ